MRGVFSALLAAITVSSLSNADEVVVLVHGLAGWGPDELLGFPYWPQAQQFTRAGFQTFIASVGPFSSAHERACELYAQIKGGTVDYGKFHSNKYSHSRFGQTYLGFYPSWNNNNPITLVGHSFGGPTIRELEYLLQNGDANERNAGGSFSPLFQGGNDKMIKVMGCIACTLSGTVLVDLLGPQFVDFIKNLLLAIVEIFTNNFSDIVYDFDLDHFGLGGNGLEIFDTSVFDFGFKDLSPYDLSIAGQRERDIRPDAKQTYPNTWYLNVATWQTENDRWYLFNGDQQADDDMWVFLKPFGDLIGDKASGDNKFNDGLVNFPSSSCASLNPSFPACQRLRSTWERGKMFYYPLNLDHLQCIGITILYSFEIDNFFKDFADLLYAGATAPENVESYSGSHVSNFRFTTYFTGAEDGSEEVDPPGLSSAATVAIAITSGLAGVLAIGVIISLLTARHRKERAIRRHAASSVVTVPSSFASVYSENPGADEL